jgi:N-acetyl-anhydromuramoyl-L-alanine amidase
MEKLTIVVRSALLQNRESPPVHIDKNHHLEQARWQPSPYFDDRPGWALPELVVIHCVSLPEGQFGTGYPEALFCGCLNCEEHPDFADLKGLEVSPHLLIERDGKVVQFVSFAQRAWHAGQSTWQGRPGCNSFAVGIELEGAVGEPFTLAQYDALIEALLALLARYPQLSPDAIVGHNESTHCTANIRSNRLAILKHYVYPTIAWS